MDTLVAAAFASVLLSIIFLVASNFALRNYPIMTKRGVYSLAGFGFSLLTSSALLIPILSSVNRSIVLYVIPALGFILSLWELYRFFVLWNRMRKIDKQRRTIK